MFYKCPRCDADMVEMPCSRGIEIACCECGYYLKANARKNPHEHITQQELDDGENYSYFKETLNI